MQLCIKYQRFGRGVTSHDLSPKPSSAQGRLVSDLQKELEECRAEMGAQDSAMAAMVQQHDMARASASDSIDRSKVQWPITMHCRTAQCAMSLFAGCLYSQLMCFTSTLAFNLPAGPISPSLSTSNDSPKSTEIIEST